MFAVKTRQILLIVFICDFAPCIILEALFVVHFDTLMTLHKSKDVKFKCTVVDDWF